MHLAPATSTNDASRMSMSSLGNIVVWKAPEFRAGEARREFLIATGRAPGLAPARGLELIRLRAFRIPFRRFSRPRGARRKAPGEKHRQSTWRGVDAIDE